MNKIADNDLYALAAPDFDTTILSGKTIERISAIFDRFFIEEGA